MSSTQPASTTRQQRQRQALTTSFQHKPPQERAELQEAMANTSNWNNLLYTARQRRGPCYDPATGMYHFVRNSKLYYSVTDPAHWKPQ
ncbi:hypothetical protein H4R35_002369 [Dimargaris xerosporica]|nr:hypothetical protein H4R35_002369 [Dimargaris xerosporica]